MDLKNISTEDLERKLDYRQSDSVLDKFPKLKSFLIDNFIREGGLWIKQFNSIFKLVVNIYAEDDVLVYWVSDNQVINPYVAESEMDTEDDIIRIITNAEIVTFPIEKHSFPMKTFPGHGGLLTPHFHTYIHLVSSKIPFGYTYPI